MNISLAAPELTDALRWSLIQRKAEEVKVLRAFGLMRGAGIEPILIKGLAAAQWYPPDVPRLSIDIDLAVSSKEFDRATAVIRSPEADGLAIDLHRELRHLDTVHWDNLISRSRRLRLSDGEVNILCPEDHLRVLCVHWLTDGGSSRDRLWDIYYAVDRRPEDLDWSRFLDVAGPRRKRWLLCTLGAASKYLGLDLTGTPAAGADRDLPKWFTDTIEGEWRSETRQQPLETTLHSPKMFFTQVKRRLRPNPIWATVQMNGDFDARTRIHYQAGNLIKRIIPSVVRIRSTLRAGK